MNNSKFIQDLQKSKFFNLLFDGKDVVMIYLAGSRLYGALDERSDYDIIVVVNGENQCVSSKFLTYNGLKVHWYWRNIETLKNSDTSVAMNCYGSMLFGLLSEENIIYKNEAHMVQVNDLLLNKQDIALMGVKAFYKTQEQLVETICSKQQINESDYTKFLGHLCVCSYYVLGEPIDEELVLKAKRIRWQPVTDEDKQKIIQRLLLLKNWVENNK